MLRNEIYLFVNKLLSLIALLGREGWLVLLVAKNLLWLIVVVSSGCDVEWARERSESGGGASDGSKLRRSNIHFSMHKDIKIHVPFGKYSGCLSTSNK